MLKIEFVQYANSQNSRFACQIWLVVNGATRNAQCATDNLSVILWGLLNERTSLKGDDHLIGGGEGCQTLFGQIIYFRHGLGRKIGKIIFMWHGLGKIYFHVNMVILNHSSGIY